MCLQHCTERFLDRRDYCPACVAATSDDFERLFEDIPVIAIEQLPNRKDRHEEIQAN